MKGIYLPILGVIDDVVSLEMQCQLNLLSLHDSKACKTHCIYYMKDTPENTT